MRVPTHRWALSSILLLCLSLAGCGDDQGTPPGKPRSGPDKKFASLEATFQTAKTAILQEDYTTFCECWTPEGRDLLAGGMVFVGNLIRFVAEKKAKTDSPEASEAKKKVERITRLLEKHGFADGVTPMIRLTQNEEHNRQEVLKLVKPIKDRNAFIGEMLTLANELSDRPNAKLLQEDAKLTELEVEGDTATGKIVQTREGKVLDRPAQFVQVNGEWKIAEIEKLLN